uniref:AAA+ ATPase domain-containing protein n=1 Tax=Palpitomonas bilix TaxID=652834 RepID=A0A7S3DBM1_9EUKA
MARRSPPVHIEVELARTAECSRDEAVIMLRHAFSRSVSTIKDGAFDVSMLADDALQSSVKSMVVFGAGSYAMPSSSFTLHFHVFRLSNEGGIGEELDEEDELPAYKMWKLPSTDFSGYWESLYFDEDIKSNLLRYCSTAMLFSHKGVDQTLVGFNRIVLLHGPPGTGKTTLCKALAQKLSIRMGSMFQYGHLVEINAHSLFSKWFSESGKLVSKLFSQLEEYVEDPSILLCILIDEVESLTAARTAAMAGNEPSDSIRVVNSVLTHLDALRTRKNVFIFTTSNLTDVSEGKGRREG